MLPTRVKLLKSLMLLNIRNRTRHFKRLFLCFLPGAVVLLLCFGCTSQEAELFLPIEGVGIPAGLTLTGQPLQGIDVRVRGPKATIENLPNLKLRYLLDLSHVDLGVNKILIDKKRILLPKGIAVTSIHPSFVTIRIEKQIQKELPVVVSFTGKPASGFFVASAIAKPLSTVLKGPENTLAAMETIQTKPLAVNGLSESFKKEIALNLSEEIKVVSSAKIVQAEIIIAQEIATKNFAAIPVLGKGSPYPYKITPPVINIEVKGPVNVLEKLFAENGINVYVELDGLKPGVYARRAAITLPLKTTLLDVKPEIFTVTIKKP